VVNIQRQSFETIFANGQAVEPDNPPSSPTLREQIEASDARSRTLAAEGTAFLAQQDAAFRERLSTGRVEIEEVPRLGGPAVAGVTNIELI